MEKGVYKHTLETKEKLSKLAKGRVSPRKGVHLSDETKEKLRQANLGKVGLVGSKNPMYGKSMSEESKEKARKTNASKVRNFTCTRCNEIKTCNNSGRLRKTCDTCLNKLNPCICGCGEFVRAAHNNSQLISGHNTTLIPSEEMKRRGQKSIDSRRKNGTLSPSPETRKKISKSVIKAHKDGKLKNSHGIRHSKGELSLKPYLESLGYIHEGDKSLRISNGFRTRYPDYYNPETKQIVEYFGTYWHRDRKLPKGKKHATEQEVINWYYKQGWECTVAWEDQTPEIIEHLQEISAGKL